MTVHGRTGCGIPSGLKFGMRSRKDSDAVESWSCLRTGPITSASSPMAEPCNDTGSTVKWKSSPRNEREKNECSRRVAQYH